MSDMILISECLAGVPCRMDGKSKMIDGGMISGNGICTELFLENGIKVFTEQEYMDQYGGN